MKACIPKSIGHYDGETLRETHNRYSEHYRQAKIQQQNLIATNLGRNFTVHITQTVMIPKLELEL